jgi:hypothetical protein
MKYDDIVQDNGFLTETGKQLVAEKFDPATKEILDIAMTDNQKRILGSILSNLIGKTVANAIQETNRINTIDTQKKIKEALKEELQKFIDPKFIDPFDNKV